jgi:glycosyltransferase involved in cell wall biosynthesis
MGEEKDLNSIFAKKIQLSAIIVTSNEEKKIRRCLESIKWVDEIVVVDQSSSDNTVTICKEYTDKVFVVSPKGFCEPDRITAANKASNDWILYIDADEEISSALRKEIELILSQEPRYESFYIPRKNIFSGKWIKGSGWYLGYVPRLFKKGFVKFPEEIHADIVALGTFGYLKENLIHYTCEDIEEYMRKLNRYTGILALQAYQKGMRLTKTNFFTKLFILPSAYAFQKLILKKGFRDGFWGFFIAFLTFLTVFLMYAKLWEMQRNDS